MFVLIANRFDQVTVIFVAEKTLINLTPKGEYFKIFDFDIF